VAESAERGESLRAPTAPEPAADAIPPRRAPEPVRPLLERVQRLTERAASRPDLEHRVSAIHKAIDEVMDIVEALKHAADQMEEVLELVELAERQKLADEREIESLRRALRQFHDRPERAPDRPRDSREQRGPRDARDQQQRGPREPRDNRTPQREPAEPRGPRDFREPQEEISEHRDPPAGSAESEPQN
jgi:hypothetical protein